MYWYIYIYKYVYVYIYICIYTYMGFMQCTGHHNQQFGDSMGWFPLTVSDLLKHRHPKHRGCRIHAGHQTHPSIWQATSWYNRNIYILHMFIIDHEINYVIYWLLYILYIYVSRYLFEHWISGYLIYIYMYSVILK